MNDTNRPLNRVVLAVTGLILLLTGAAVIAALAWPRAAALWSETWSAVRFAMTDGANATRIADGPASWLGIGIAAGLVFAALALLAIPIVTLGRRSRARDAGVAERTELGRIAVTESFASQALLASLEHDDDIVSSRVAVRRTGGAPLLHVDVIPRRRVSPVSIATRVDRLIANLGRLTGDALPAVVTIRSSVRARLASDARRVD